MIEGSYKKMKLRKVILFLNLSILIMTTSIFSLAYQNNLERIEDKNDRNEAMLKNLSQSNMKEIYLALVEINRNIEQHPLTDLIIEQILRLAENEHKNKESSSMKELGEEYSSELIIALGNTRDSRAVTYLMEYLGSGTAVARSLRKIGEPAIDPLINKIHDEIVGYRSSAAQALGFFLKPEEDGFLANEEIKKKIKQALIKELNDPRNREPEKNIEWYEIRAKERANVRLNIVKALGYLAETGDSEVIPIIKPLAEEDPYFLDMSRKTNYKGPLKKYIVRDEAQKILEKLKTNKGKK